MVLRVRARAWWRVAAFLALATNVHAGRSVRLELIPAPQSLFLDEAPSSCIMRPSTGQVMVVGRFNDAAFAIDGIDRLTLIASSGLEIPLTIDEKSIYREFDQIVSLRLCFSTPASSVESTGDRFTLRWGPDVNGKNKSTASFALDPSLYDQYRSFRWSAGTAGLAEDLSLTTIDVIADSHADYYCLWYLLPMALIFALLTVRKFRACRNDLGSSH